MVLHRPVEPARPFGKWLPSIPDQVGETNSYERPNSYAKGVPYVLVNGVLVIDKGMHTGARPGKVVYGPGYKREQLMKRAGTS